jgi:cyclase
MHRRRFIRNSALATALFTLDHKHMFPGTDPAFKITMLRNGIGIFSEQGGTIAFDINQPSIVVVDAEFPEQASHLITELKKKSTEPFSLLINTHHHADHTSGNIQFKGLVQHVVAHQNSLANQRAVAEKQNTMEKQLLPDVTFTDTWKGSNGKDSIKAYYFGAAHTNGDSVIHFEKPNIVHVGDLVFNRRFAFVDRSAGASIRSWILVLDKILANFDNDTLFIFGHAYDPNKVTGNKDDLRAMQNYLGKMMDYVQVQIKAGKSKEDIIKSTTSIPGAPEWKGDHIERGLGAAYDELTS